MEQTTGDEVTRTIDDDGYSAECDPDENEKPSPNKKKNARPSRQHKVKGALGKPDGGKKKKNRK